MKHNQRLDYTRLSEALSERGIASPVALQDALQQSVETGDLLPAILVDENIVSDWELARVVSEVFNVPFLTVDSYAPDEGAREGLDPAFLRRFCLVPLDRFGDLLTVAMPAVVPSEVLKNLSQQAEAQVLPVVGTVLSNRRWLQEHLPEPKAQLDDIAAPLPGADPALGWESMFDEADQAVKLDLVDLPELEELDES